MKPAQIWWEQVGNALGLLSEVTNHLRDCKSAVLHLPAAFPWRQSFYDAIESRRTRFSESRRLVTLEWDGASDPGETVLEELCSMEVRAEYYPGMTRAAYLGSRDDIVLCDYYVWVAGIHSKAQLLQWTEFLDQYDRAARKAEKKAVFILEYDGTDPAPVSVETVRFTLEDYDCRVFCLEAAALLSNSSLRFYQAELALSIGGTDPEFCHALLARGEQLLADPVAATGDVIAFSRAADGRRFAHLEEQQILSAVWKAQLVLFFPVLEQRRVDFVQKYRDQIARHLPITESNGDRITDPLDLEIGPLCYIIASSGSAFPGTECEAIHLCRKVRNTLAHNKVLALEEVKRLYGV